MGFSLDMLTIPFISWMVNHRKESF